jgi:hypothetical protein
MEMVWGRELGGEGSNFGIPVHSLLTSTATSRRVVDDVRRRADLKLETSNLGLGTSSTAS